MQTEQIIDLVNLLSLHIAGLQAQQQQAVAQTAGTAPLVQSAVLTDRRHILTKDADGNVDLWDAAMGSVVKHFGKVCACVAAWRHC